jgi:hypothetical protein
VKIKNFSTFFFCISIVVQGCKNDSIKPPQQSLSLIKIELDGKIFSQANKGVSVTPAIKLYFSAPLDKSSAQSTIAISNGSTNVPSSYSFSNSDSSVILKPNGALAYFHTNWVQILSDLKSSSGIKIDKAQSLSIFTTYDPAPKFPTISDDALLDLVQQQTIKYFYDYGHPTSGLARERNSSGDIVTTGGSGFGLMAMIVGIDRGFIPRTDGIARFNKIVSFLETADRFHGVWPHWMNGSSGKVIPFSTNDNGADLVETSFMAQGLITLKQYLVPADTVGNNLINRINSLWYAIEWDWFRQETQKSVLYWHWSPDKGWIMNFALSGYFEEQITYFLAAASPTHAIPKIVYTNGFGQNGSIKTGNTYTYNNESYVLPLGSPSPLFWTQYSYLGLDPHFSDDYANYWTQNVNASLINHAYCVANPKKYFGYSDSCWGLTASDNPTGYDAQSPQNDNGTISPTAALSAFPYTPDQSMKALKFFYYTLGDKLWGQYGFYDAFNLQQGWVASSTLAIDQGPIVVMIENYRTQLLWNLFMSAPEVQAAKIKLGFN